MVAGSCCSSIRTFRICLLQNWKMTRNQFGWKCLQTKLLILWQVGSTSEEFHREQLDYIRTHHEGKKLSSVHVLGDFNFKDIDWPDRLSKSGSTLSQSEGQILIDIMNDHGLEQMVHFPIREKTYCTWFSPLCLVSFKMSTPLTNLVIMTPSQEP